MKFLISVTYGFCLVLYNMAYERASSPIPYQLFTIPDDVTLKLGMDRRTSLPNIIHCSHPVDGTCVAQIINVYHQCTLNSCCLGFL